MGKNPIQVFLGVDGGGSNTRALLVDQNGGRISEGNSLGSNPHNGGYHLAASSINEAVQATIENAAPAQIKIESAFCGIAGIRNAEEQELLFRESANKCVKQMLPHRSDLPISGQSMSGGIKFGLKTRQTFPQQE